MTNQRLNFDAHCEADVFQYYQTRARQIQMDGFVWDGELFPMPGGWGTFFYKNNKRYGSFYGHAGQRGRGFAKKGFQQLAPIVTSPDCHIEAFLKHHEIDYLLAGQFFQSEAYKKISNFYHDRKAKRSQCFLMNHIDEGLYVLNQLEASRASKEAFCIHPLLQNDNDLEQNWNQLKDFDGEILALAMEYRNIANAYLSQRKIDDYKEIVLSPISDVNDMLKADKVQNYKDFLIYHQHTHPRRKELHCYFQFWLKRLNISHSNFEHFFQHLKRNDWTIDFKIQTINNSLLI